MKIRGEIANIPIGDDYNVVIVGVLNVSPESFYKGSITKSKKEIEEKALKMIEEGAKIIDVGAMSTAPGVPPISLTEEKRRMRFAIRTLRDIVSVPISADTFRAEVADTALREGATIVNDVSGLKADKGMAQVISEYDASVIVMAAEARPGDVGSIPKIKDALRQSLQIAKDAGITEEKIVIDPGIGFGKKVSEDLHILRNLNRLRALCRPILVGISRKSFIGKILNLNDPRERLIGSLAATAIAVYNGAHLVRTHDVKETLQAVKIAEAIKRRVISSSVEGISATLLYTSGYLGDIEDLLIKIGVDQQALSIFNQKSTYIAILVENISTPAALIIKQEMLACGGDVALPKEMIDFHLKEGSIIIFGTYAQYRRLVKKLEKMPFNLGVVAKLLKHILGVCKESGYDSYTD
ncbi:MAG: dihydropteroate synthase [Candidatus Baldrarchaeia archaeon]